VQELSESAGSVHKSLEDSTQHVGLSCDKISLFSADDANMNFGKKSVYQHLLSDNDTVAKANCTAHIIHNCCKHASELMDIDIEVVILKASAIFHHLPKEEKPFHHFLNLLIMSIVNC
jgi:hypothetical protein